MQKGYTLVELLLYVSITALMLFIISIFLLNLLQSRVKNQTIAEVEQQGTQVMQLISQTIRNADSITFPPPGISASSLALDSKVFDISGSTIRIKEGVGSPISLTSSRVTVSNVSFHNLSETGTSGNLRIQFTITHINPAGRNEYDYSKTFYGSASLR